MVATLSSVDALSHTASVNVAPRWATSALSTSSSQPAPLWTAMRTSICGSLLMSC